MPARSIVLGAVAMAALGTSFAPAGATRKEHASVPWSVSLDVHWGAKKNREQYRTGFEQALLAELLEKACFASVLEKGRADLVLEVQIDDFATEQEYRSTGNLLPGAGDTHQLRSARAKVRLDYSLHPRGQDDREILVGRLQRESVREPLSPADQPEERASHDLMVAAVGWVVHEICDRPRVLAEKIAAKTAPSKPAP